MSFSSARLARDALLLPGVGVRIKGWKSGLTEYQRIRSDFPISCTVHKEIGIATVLGAVLMVRRIGIAKVDRRDFFSNSKFYEQVLE